MTSSEFDVLAKQMEQTGRQIGDVLDVLETLIKVVDSLADRANFQSEATAYLRARLDEWT